MTSEILEEIAALVRSGFHGKDDLMELICEEILAPGEVDPEEVESIIEQELIKHAEDEKSWPAVTDCDRLDAVFESLNERGIVALQNAGQMQDDGYENVWTAYPDAADDERTIGYCFFHSQDLMHAVRGHGLHLAFGPVDPEDEETRGADIGHIIQEELEKAGFAVRWDGTFNQRIFIPKIDWKRRWRDEHA